jgi:hypothetical protein
MGATVTLSLISHTNVGKTTLARTLLRRDVGEVLDQAHVTEVSEAHELLRSEGHTLQLWDTPGFGDTARLMRRLRRENDPIGWFLHQVWDRMMDRPLWCGQEAARNIKGEADVVLYLVNATEEPQDAGYVPLELELLSWIGRPVLLLLNQVGEDDRGLESRWRELVASRPIVRDVLALDAFTRGWPQEVALLERVVDLLDGEKRRAMESLATAWNRRNLAVFDNCCELMADYLATAAADREAARPNGGESDGSVVGVLKEALTISVLDRKRAMAALGKRLDTTTRQLMERMIAEHGLYGDSAARIEQRLRDYQVKGSLPISERSGAIAGAVVSGALGGLAADAISGGLTLGGGMIAGGILGALGGSALARGYRLVGGREEPSVQWTPEFLDALCKQVLLRYLAVAHFGRGRGAYRDIEQPGHWTSAVDRALTRHESALGEIWKAATSEHPQPSPRTRSRLRDIVADTARTILRSAYG